MQNDLGAHRKSYEKSKLDESLAPASPLDLFSKWFYEAGESGLVDEPNAMTLSTIGLDGWPRSRVVLLKGFSEDGFLFFTNYSSEKGRAIAAKPEVCLSFFWPPLERQVLVKGTASKTSSAVSDAYFASRPRGSQLGAIASDQSTVVPSRAELDASLAMLEKKYQGKDIPRPSDWGGYLVSVREIEFWQGRANRLHDRLRYSLQDKGDWKLERLAP